MISHWWIKNKTLSLKFIFWSIVVISIYFSESQSILTWTHHTISFTPISMDATKEPEAFGTVTFITSFSILAVLWTRRKLLTLVDVCGQNKTKYATSAPIHSLAILLLFKSIFTNNEDWKDCRWKQADTNVCRTLSIFLLLFNHPERLYEVWIVIKPKVSQLISNEDRV